MIRLSTSIHLTILNRQPLPYANLCCVVLASLRLFGWQEVRGAVPNMLKFASTHLSSGRHSAIHLQVTLRVHSLRTTYLVVLYQAMRFHSGGSEGRNCWEFHHGGICPFSVPDSDSHHRYQQLLSSNFNKGEIQKAGARLYAGS